MVSHPLLSTYHGFTSIVAACLTHPCICCLVVFCCVVFVSTVGNFGKDIVFGELALLYDAPRAATIKVTSTATVLWRIGRDVFKYLIRSAVQATSTQIMDTLNQVALLQPLTNDQKLQVSAKCQDPFVFKIQSHPKNVLVIIVVCF